MGVRRIKGRHPSDGSVGLWISRPGFDALTDDRTDRTKFLVSTSFAGRVPFRLIGAGLKNTNERINLPGSLASLGGNPMLTYRPMSDANTERRQGYSGVENDGAGNAYGGSEFYCRLFDDENPAFFIICNTANVMTNRNNPKSPTGTSVLMRYMILLY